MDVKMKWWWRKSKKKNGNVRREIFFFQTFLNINSAWKSNFGCTYLCATFVYSFICIFSIPN